MTTTFPALDEVEGKLAERQKSLATIFEEAGETIDLSKVKSFNGDSAAVAAEIKKLNDEMTELGIKRDEHRAVWAAAQASKQRSSEENEGGEGGDGGRERNARVKSFGELFVEAKAGQKGRGEVDLADFNVKTLFQTTAGLAPSAVRSDRIVLDEQRPIQMADLIPTRPTSLSSWTYMEETTFTNNAAETAEGGAKPEAALALTERTANVRKIAVWIPVTDEQLEDVEGIAAYLDNRLSLMVRQRLDSQMVSGDGSAPNLRGLLNVSGIQTQAKGADPTPDAVYKAMTKVQVTGQAMANLAVFHPNDWQEVRLLRTADGVYIWGNPSEAGPERIWGLQVSKVQAATEGTAIVLDTSFTELAIKKGLTVETSNSHDDYFVKNKQAVRAEMRAAFTVYRPTAVCSVTGV